MFSRFTEKAIQTIMLAQEEAKKYHHNYVGTEHILLGIIGEGDNVVLEVLNKMGYSREKIQKSVEDKVETGNITSDYGNVPFTQQAKQILTFAWDEARKLGHNYVNVEHLFLSVFREPTSIAARVLSELGINLEAFKHELFTHLGDKYSTPVKKAQSEIPTPSLDLYGRDLTHLADDNKLDPVIGRDKEIERMVQIICRRSKNNPVLTGEPGVGKTAIVEGFAQRIIKGSVPEKLKNKRVINLDLGLLVAGTKYRGEFEDRVKKVMEEVRKAKNVIVFVDELHTIIGTGGSEGSLDAANLFKPALARGELQCIGATTLDEYRKHIEGDGALERRFQSILVEEPSKEEALEILGGIKARYEEFHDVTITKEALEAAVELAMRYITERSLPDKAVDLIDEAASKVMLEVTADTKNVIEKVVTAETISAVVSAWTGVPITQLSEEEGDRLMKMEETLQGHIVGQDDAIIALARAVKRAKIGLKDPKRPTGSFLFLGPSGVGKSELAKRLAEFIFGSEDALIRIDMSEFMEKHTVSRLIGSPPGYVGFNEGGQLTEPIRRKPYSVVLFDELEKASPEVINILLQILEDGRLTDSTGRTVNFKNTIIVMTSNVGSKFIEKETSFGFVDASRVEDTQYEGMKTKLVDELRREFRPEFLNRIDDIVIFKTLNKQDMMKIIDIMLRDVYSRLADMGITITLGKKEKQYLVDKGFVERQGARPLRRAIQEHFEDKIADFLLKNNLRRNLSVKVVAKKDGLSFSSASKKKSIKKSTPKKEAVTSSG